MTAESDKIADYVDAAAALLGIPVAPEWRAGVASHLAIILGNAELVLEAAQAAAEEPAPLFEVE
jgi:Protein of unknown function (DUF4089)